jgi:hypothetical protein
MASSPLRASNRVALRDIHDIALTLARCLR